MARSCFLLIDSSQVLPFLSILLAHVYVHFIEIESEFQRQLHSLVPRLLDPNKLVVKKINGHQITCRELVEYFKVAHLLYCFLFPFLLFFFSRNQRST